MMRCFAEPFERHRDLTFKNPYNVCKRIKVKLYSHEIRPTVDSKMDVIEVDEGRTVKVDEAENAGNSNGRWHCLLKLKYFKFLPCPLLLNRIYNQMLF